VAPYISDVEPEFFYCLAETGFDLRAVVVRQRLQAN
jgi:hypothetical protein